MDAARRGAAVLNQRQLVEESETGAAPLGGGAPGFALHAATPELVERISPEPPGPISALRSEINELNRLGLAKFTARDYPAAADLLAQVVNRSPDSFAAHGNYAIVLRPLKRAAEAEAHARRALALNPGYATGYKVLAELLTERRDVDGALKAYERLVALEPRNIAAHNNTALLLRKIGKLDEALAAVSRASALDPENPQIRFNMLMLKRDDAVLEEATALCRRALERHPASAEILVNLAVCTQFSGHYAEAVACLERAVALNPDHREAAFNLSLLLLLLGDYARGWRLYEERWRLLETTKPRLPQPEWRGEDLGGRTILLVAEQGYGDSIQALRYVPQVAARGGRVVLHLDRPLVRLAAGLPGNVVIVPKRAPLPTFDVWCPMLSLPGIFNTTAETIPTGPYLRPRQPIVERWRSRLGDLRGLKVGLAWAGSPIHVNDYRRSIGLERLKPLLEAPGVSFVSLQVGPRAADLAALGPHAVADIASDLTDFAETAGAILNLDLVIAVDTSVVHLAGALGRPAWVMLPFCPDWRWLLDRDDTPWYPSLKLYRQDKPGNWDRVVARVAADLAAIVAGRADCHAE
jgi:tetratricopeptide (TPR) repeat protein